MSPAVWGAILGGVAAMGTLLVAVVLAGSGRPRLAVRVLPYLRDLPQVSPGGLLNGTGEPLSILPATAVRAAARRLDRMLGGAASVSRRLERAALDITVHDFRMQQVVWGVAAFSVSAGLSLLIAVREPDRSVALLLLCAASFAFGVVLRDYRLSAQVRRRERSLVAEFPTVAELLALSVAAGEGPVAALDRLASRCHGELAAELARVLADVRTGAPASSALDAMAARSGVPVLTRFAEAMAVALERGTPLADVLHAQAGDVREASRRALIETGARREVLMMVPVVFLVLPVTVVFAFWPGMVGLRLVAP